MRHSIELRTFELELVRKILAGTISDLEVWAFGLRVHRRQLKEFSDLDLVVFPEEDPLLDLGVLRENLADSDLTFTVVVSSWSQLPDWLQQVILQDHVILQASKQLSSLPFVEHQEFSELSVCGIYKQTFNQYQLSSFYKCAITQLKVFNPDLPLQVGFL